MYAVIYLARFSACYDSQHFAALKRILRYLVTTIDKGLTYAPKLIGKAEKASRVKIEIKMYTDSDWASDKNDRKSFSGRETCYGPLVNSTVSCSALYCV